jgi:hypothetical protein
MNEAPSSPYYPRRRRWYSDLLHEAVLLWRRLNIPTLTLPRKVSCWRMFCGLALPGQAFVLTGWPRLGRGIQIGWLLGVLVFFAALGYAVANVIFSLLIAAHVASMFHWLTFISGDSCIRTRLVYGAGSWLLLGLCIYFPLRGVMLEHWLVPLRTAQSVVVVNRAHSFKKLQRGDFIAYRIGGEGSSGVNISGGFGVGDVIGRPGDEIRITPRLLFVNGRPQLRRPHMPREAGFTLAQKQWFVWPDFDIRNNNRAITAAKIAAAWLHTGMIHEEQIVGQPYRRWFGRQQSRAGVPPAQRRRRSSKRAVRRPGQARRLPYFGNRRDACPTLL